ncbi:MAG: hypothetical protein IJT16_00315 [Lachnospiraceae bacterium]|nr:hypothetical protein [Lachnospiraceae bacterium]
MRAEASDRRSTFLWGCLLGAACFLLIYGIRILNPTYDDWLLLGDMDLKQHYIGFCHFRVSNWQFPIGLIETLSYPNKMSVIYTDSIPLLAVLFKLFAWILPQRFQYFGLAGLMSFMLMGGFSSLLLYRFLNNKIASVIYSVFFIISYPIIQRMYYHTALASQWIIIAALALWLYQEELSLRTRLLLWALLGFFCVSIHSYFLPMAGLILLCAAVDEVLTVREIRGSVCSSVRNGALELILFCASALFALILYGGFYGDSNAVGEGLGTFTSNLNTFVNPLDDGRLYGSLPTYNGFQYEGFGYLGGGILFLLITGAIAAGVSYIYSRKRFRLFQTGYRPLLAAALFTVSCMLSMFPIVTLNDKKLFGVPYPGFIRKLLGIFRSNGRFIWTAVYLLMLLAITLCYRSFFESGNRRGAAGVERKKGSRVLFYGLTILSLGLQLFDISEMLAGKHNYFAKEQTYDCFWENSGELSGSIAESGETLQDAISPISFFQGIVFLYNENDILMDSAYFAYLNGMWQNNYYYARDINPVIDRNVEEWKETLRTGFVRGDIIYVFRKQDVAPELTEGLTSFELRDHIIGIRKK